MLIDWFTVVAQIINFLILVWLLKRFLYQPIFKALDAREKRIAAELAAAAARKSEAEKERDTFRQKNEELDRQRAALLSKASAEAQAERHWLIEAARTDADNLRARWEEALKTEYQALSEALTRRTCMEVFAVARRVLADLASTTLEAHMTDAFIRRMRELSPEEKANLASTIKVLPPGSLPGTTAAGLGVMVRSAFDLSTTQQNAIKAVVEESLGVNIPVRFATEPDLVSGIELITHGHKVAWSIAGYLALLEKEIGKLLKNHVEPGPEAEGEAESAAEVGDERKPRGPAKIERLNTPNLKPSARSR